MNRGEKGNGKHYSIGNGRSYGLFRLADGIGRDDMEITPL